MGDIEEQIKWLIDRSDRLRSGLSTGAGAIVSAIAIAMSGSSVVLAYVTKTLLPTAPVNVWPMRILIGGLFLSLLILAVAMLFAISAIAATHGFHMSRSPGENTRNSIADVRHEREDGLSGLPLLESQLKTAGSFQRDAQARLKTSLFMVCVALVMPLVSLMVGVLFAK